MKVVALIAVVALHDVVAAADGYLSSCHHLYYEARIWVEAGLTDSVASEPY